MGGDGFGDHRIEVVHVQAIEIFGWDDELDIAVKRLPLVWKLELTPARHGCHGRRTMIVREVFCLASL